jgi:hypothetical protein
MDEITRVLVGCTDAQVWAQKFIETQRIAPDIATDEGTMIGWFANAIMSGWDAGARHERERDFMEKLHEVIYQAAGAATLPFMQDHPDYTFPSERVVEGIEAVLKDFGIPPRGVPG